MILKIFDEKICTMSEKAVILHSRFGNDTAGQEVWEDVGIATRTLKFCHKTKQRKLFEEYRDK